MSEYYFEQWQAGQMKQHLIIQATDVSEAVSRLSDEYKGVFRLVPQLENEN